MVRHDGRAGRILLNRPRALNALDAGMIRTIALALETWRDDPDVHLVVVEGAGDRAFCAGGDVRTLRDWVVAGEFDRIDGFFVDEYALNRTIARYPKPYVALIDGLWMGGGVGLAVHGGHRVVTENARFGMPEAQIGLFPDVGASFVLPRLRGAFGMFLGLTGQRVGAADACWLGLATHHVAQAAGLGDALAASGLGALIERSISPGIGEFAAIAGEVDAVFGLGGVAEIMTALEGRTDAWAPEALAGMRRASPTSLQWTFDLLRAGASRSLEQCQRAELLLTREAMRLGDFVEGVRALVIDKDRAPQWRPG